MSTQFRSNQLGGIVVDEMCKCGHLKSDHGSHSINLGDGHMIRESHEGNCCARKCECPGFTWARFVIKEEAAQIHKRKKQRAVA